MKKELEMNEDFNTQHCSNKNCTLTKGQFEQLQKYIRSLEYGQKRFYRTKHKK